MKKFFEVVNTDGKYSITECEHFLIDGCNVQGIDSIHYNSVFFVFKENSEIKIDVFSREVSDNSWGYWARQAAPDEYIAVFDFVFNNVNIFDVPIYVKRNHVINGENVTLEHAVYIADNANEVIEQLDITNVVIK